MRSLSLLVLGALAALTTSTYASTITYTESFTGSGVLDGVGFTNAQVTYTETGDTSNVVNPHPGYSYSVLPATVTVAGLGTDSLRDAFTLEDIQFSDSNGSLELVNPNVGFVILFAYSNAYGLYNLSTSLHPTYSNTQYISGFAVATNSGNITIGDVKDNLIFQATIPQIAITPEPSSLILLATGSLGLAGTVRRRVSL